MNIVIDHDHGFFSNCTVLLSSLIHAEGTKITSIDTTKSFSLYKENESDDVYAKFFKPFSGCVYESFPFNIWWPHDRYLRLPLEKIMPWVNDYFQLRDEIKTEVAALLESHDLDLSGTAGVFLRGSDKVSEVPGSNLEEIAAAINKINLEHFSTLLIQTNDLNLLSQLNELITIPIRTLSIEESESVYVYGSHLKGTMQNNGINKRFLAIVFLLSQCKEIYLNSSNVSFWIVLFRGNINGVTQFLETPIWYTPEL